METNERVDYACLQVTLISPFFDPLFLLSSGSNGDTLPLYTQSWGHKWEERSWSWRVGSSNPNLGHLFILLFRWFGVQEYSKGPCRDLPLSSPRKMNDDSKAKQKQRFSKIVSVKSHTSGHVSALPSHREGAVDSMQVSVHGCGLVNYYKDRWSTGTDSSEAIV